MLRIITSLHGVKRFHQDGSKKQDINQKNYQTKERDDDIDDIMMSVASMDLVGMGSDD